MKSCLARFILAGLFVAGVLSACSTDAPSTASASSRRICQPNSHVVCIVRGDSGRNIRVHIGETVTLYFDDTGLNWTGPSQVGPHLLFEITPVRREDMSFTVSYSARAVGQTALVATGAPRCTRTQACPQFILLWRVEISVLR